MATIDATTGQLVTPPAPTVATVQPPTAQTVYSAPNIQTAATIGSTPVNPVLDEYNQYINTPELQAAKATTTQLQQAINAEKAGLRNTTTGLEYQNDQALGTTGASVNLIGRQVGRASELSTNRQAALGEQYNAALAYQQGLEQMAREKYNIVQAEKSKIQSLIAQTGNQAGILPTDTFEVATSKAYKWEQKQKKKEEKKAKEAADKKSKEELRTAILKLGGSTKNAKGGSLSTSKLKKLYEELTVKEYKDKKAKDAPKEGLYQIATRLKNQGKNWGEIAAEVGKKYDLTPGSAGSQALDAIMTGKPVSSGAAPSGEVKKLMDSLGVSQDTAEKLILEEMKSS